MDIYLVVGRTGEYSDRRVWIVAAYLEKEMAETHAAAANQHCAKFTEESQEQRCRTGEPLPEMHEYREVALGNPYDNELYAVDSIIDYWVMSVPLVSHLDEYLELIAGQPRPAPTSRTV
jgi:hypothetical protein